MKILFCFFIPFLLFAGCKRHLNNEITVIGHLKGIDVKGISLKSDDLSFKAPIDSNGTFVLKFVIDQPRAYKLEFNSKLNLFLIPGDSVIITKDGEDYKFSGGQSAVLSNYYLEWDKYWNKLTDTVPEKKFYSQEPDDFTKTIYKYIDALKVPLNELSKKILNINPEFMSLEKERLKYRMIVHLQAYGYEMHKYHTGKDPVLEESFHNYMKDVNLNDSSLLQLEEYKRFLTEYIFYKSRKNFQSNIEISKDRYALTNIMLNSVSHEFKNQRVIDYVIHNLIFDQTKLLLVDDKNLAIFKELCKNKEYITDVENLYKELQTLMPGKPAPDFEFYDSNDKKYTLSDFKGKYLLIDVWGAYCGPCIKEAPYLNQIVLDYKGKNIEFIGTCLENNKEIWLKRIKEYKLGGIQLTVKGGWDSQFKKDYQIPWIPTYILIDKEGKIINARASKPSENLRDLLNMTLENKI
jgi:thiol-disulfide isomerase/thioredoxin